MKELTAVTGQMATAARAPGTPEPERNTSAARGLRPGPATLTLVSGPVAADRTHTAGRDPAGDPSGCHVMGSLTGTWRCLGPVVRVRLRGAHARRAADRRRSRMRMILPSLTVTHSAPGALLTGSVSVSYITTACGSSPNATISSISRSAVACCCSAAVQASQVIGEPPVAAAGLAELLPSDRVKLLVDLVIRFPLNDLARGQAERLCARPPPEARSGTFGVHRIYDFAAFCLPWSAFCFCLSDRSSRSSSC